MSEFKAKLNKTREYLDYLEEHYDNVQKAFKEAIPKWYDEEVIYEEYLFDILEDDVKYHDMSKLSKEEFVQYRQSFFPTDYEIDYANSCYGITVKDYFKESFNLAWENHKRENKHHWQSIESFFLKISKQIDYAHMLIDWIAMGYKFNNTAIDYYEKNKEEINLEPEWDIYVRRLLDKFYNSVEE